MKTEEFKKFAQLVEFNEKEQHQLNDEENQLLRM